MNSSKQYESNRKLDIAIAGLALLSVLLLILLLVNPESGRKSDAATNADDIATNSNATNNSAAEPAGKIHPTNITATDTAGAENNNPLNQKTGNGDISARNSAAKHDGDSDSLTIQTQQELLSIIRGDN